MRGGAVSPTERWRALLEAFRQGHATRANLAVHGLTTPVGLWAALALAARLHPLAPGLLVAPALLWSWTILPSGLAAVHTLLSSAIVLAASSTTGPLPGLVGALVGAFLLQDLAHRASGEPTYESTYLGQTGAAKRWLEHVVLLLPLVIAAFPRARGRVFGGLVARRAVRTTRLSDEGERKALRALRDRILADRPKADTTTMHAWIHELEPAARAACQTIVDSSAIDSMLRERHGPRARIRSVDAMNEVYVAGPDRETTSDRVFYLPHLDGPFPVFPGATLYRCMVAVSPNRRIRTHFPLERDGAEQASVVLDEAEVVAFDYHRTLHAISVDPDAPVLGPRISLKLHYVVSQPGLARWADLLAALSARYNARARALFVETLKPTGPIDRLKARAILVQTRVWQQIAQYLGHRNLLYVALLALASALVGSPWPLVAGGSFVHHGIYMATFAAQADVSFGVFRRDAVFYKTLSLALLGALYLTHFELDPVSLGLMLFGFGTAAYASEILGLDRTFFGAELGVCSRERIDRFPYGSIPHPMILGSIIGLLGMAELEPLRRAWPWLIPIHVAFYLGHLAQEILDRRGAGRE